MVIAAVAVVETPIPMHGDHAIPTMMAFLIQGTVVDAICLVTELT